MILANANVLTLDPALPRAAALGLRDGQVLAVGTVQEVRAALPGAAELDLGGATVLPGLVDAHGHLLMLGERMAQLDLGDARSPQEVASRVAARAARALPGEWILGKGWDQNVFPGGGFPDRGVLDGAAPDHPVFLERVDGHAAWVNGRALAAAGTLGDAPGGRVVRDAHGEPTGILVDRAMDAVTARIPPAGPAELEALLATAARRCASLGLTGVHDAGMTLRPWEALERLAESGRLPLRVYGMAWTADADCARLTAAGPRLGGRGLLTLRAAKFFLDGALGSRGAALFEGYADDPGNRGLLLADTGFEEELRRWMERGFQVAIHAIGDRANAFALDALERALGSGAAGGDARPRIEHAQLLRPADVRRFAAHGIVASMQPAHATGDMGWIERAIGPGRVEGAYAWRSLLESGARLAFGSDFPIEDPNPLAGLHAATTRQDRAGLPEGGWTPRERLGALDALRAYAEGPAWAAFEEGVAGRIRPGARADLTVLDRDPLEAARDRALLETHARMTVVAGEIVWQE